MNLSKEKFISAIQIIAMHHSSRITINQPKNDFVGNLGQDEYNIYIHKCVPAVIDNLYKAGFSLSMTENGLEVFFI